MCSVTPHYSGLGRLGKTFRQRQTHDRDQACRLLSIGHVPDSRARRSRNHRPAPRLHCQAVNSNHGEAGVRQSVGRERVQLWHFESRCKCTTVGPTGRSASDSGLLVGGVVANTQHFFQGRDTRNCFCHTIFQQCSHAVEPRLPTDRLGRFPIESHLTDWAVHAKQLEDCLTSAVARVIAIRAPATSHETAAVGLLGG